MQGAAFPGLGKSARCRVNFAYNGCPMSKPAARLTDMHTCPMSDGPKPHVGGPISAPGCPTVLIAALPAARVGDMAVCVGPPDSIAVGSPTVLIGGQMAARLGDQTAHGGVIVVGCPTVLIGETGSGSGGGGGAGGAAGSGEAAQAETGGKVGAASPAPAADAFEAAAKSGAALVCKGPCPACGQI